MNLLFRPPRWFALRGTALALLGLALWLAVARAEALEPDPPRSLSLDLAAPVSQWLPQVLPAGARLLHGPQTLPFGAHASGQFLAWRGADGGYALVYLTPEADDPRRQRWLWLREPRDADFGMDVEVRAVLAVGPALSRDIVVLETFSRPAPAGGAREDAGSVFRSVVGGVQPMPALGELLRDVPNAVAARAVLAPAYSGLLPAVPGRLAKLFASLPWPQVELTALERLQRLLPGHPAFETYDSANGFLDIRGDAGLPGYQAALFRHADGGWMLAVQKRWPDTQRTWYMRQSGDDAAAWIDVSDSVMPGFDPDLDYLLPRRGVRVQAAGHASGAPTHWVWEGRRFRTVAPDR